MPAPPTRAESCPATCHMMTDPQPSPKRPSRYCLHIYTLDTVDIIISSRNIFWACVDMCGVRGSVVV